MTAYDPTGWEREPFDGRVPAPTVGYTSPAPRGHGPQCNPEAGCSCGEDERQSLYDETHPPVRALQPGQVVAIYGGLAVTVLDVVPDREPYSRYVTLHYRVHMAKGHVDAVWKLAGHRRLPRLP